MYFGGIDPGVKGGIALVSQKHQIFWAISMPKDPYDLADVFRKLEGAQNLIEIVNPMPRRFIDKKTGEKGQASMGAKSAFTQGQNYGLLEGVMVALKLRHEYIRPTVWQREMGVPRRKDESQGDHKRRMKRFVQGLYPSLKVTLNTADALLIATYAERRALGK